MQNHKRAALGLPAVLLVTALVYAQTAPTSPAHPWKSDALSELPWKPPVVEGIKSDFDSVKIYTLAELIDIAESHNPQTRVAWQRARAEAASLGIARSALYPTLAAVALAETTRQRVLVGSQFYRQTLETAQPALAVDYTIFDSGVRRAQIDFSKANLLRASLDFNNTHLEIILRVTHSYYRVLRASGEQSAAEANLVSARTAQDAVESRLKAGLATLPDALQARAATAQAGYELASVKGEEDIAHGELNFVTRYRSFDAMRERFVDFKRISEARFEVFTNPRPHEMLLRVLVLFYLTHPKIYAQGLDTDAKEILDSLH